jgi:tRNA(fMet)-specific endonuclease VapC
MPRYMLDTDISSYIMKRSSQALLKKLETTLVSDVCISAITKAELMFGVEVSPRKRQDKAALDAYLLYAEVLDFPGDAAIQYAAIRADLKLRGVFDRGKRSLDCGSCPASEPRARNQ